MPDLCAFDYAIVRVVPRVDRGEFINAGVILFCSTRGYLDARIELSRERLLALDPTIDVALVESHLAVIPKVCAGGGDAGSIGELPQRARFHWLVAPRSTMIQMSPMHSGVHRDPETALEGLFRKLVQTERRRPAPRRGTSRTPSSPRRTALRCHASSLPRSRRVSLPSARL